MQRAAGPQHPGRLPDGGRGHADAVVVVLDLGGDANDHAVPFVSSRPRRASQLSTGTFCQARIGVPHCPDHPEQALAVMRKTAIVHSRDRDVLAAYGKALQKQNGAPLRTVIPWKYGFKSIKSIVAIEFVERQPRTSWALSAPDGRVGEKTRTDTIASDLCEYSVAEIERVGDAGRHVGHKGRKGGRALAAIEHGEAVPRTGAMVVRRPILGVTRSLVAIPFEMGRRLGGGCVETLERFRRMRGRARPKGECEHEAGDQGAETRHDR